MVSLSVGWSVCCQWGTWLPVSVHNNILTLFKLEKPVTNKNSLVLTGDLHCKVLLEKKIHKNPKVRVYISLEPTHFLLVLVSAMKLS